MAALRWPAVRFGRIRLALALAGSLAVSAVPASAEQHPNHASTGGDAPVLQGMGSYHRTITTSSAEAQRFFDQGLNLLYAFNPEEAERSFRKATALDPDCGMCRWGLALSLGHNINLPPMRERAEAAFTVADKAGVLGDRGTPVERALTQVLTQRYSEYFPTTPEEQHRLDQAYADAMRGVYQLFPDDPDVATLFAESLMDLRPWDYWTADGKPQPGTEELVAVLEGVLAKHPEHPGANHYYIHALEAGPRRDQALPSADRLRDLVPGAGHLVHMPSHLYQQVGRYRESAEANRKGVQADRDYIQAAGADSFMYTMYLAHNHQFLAFTAIGMGRRAEAMENALGATRAVPATIMGMMPGTDFFLTTPDIVRVRFAMWDEILADPTPRSAFPYTRAIRHYARGLAFAGLGRVREAERERDSLKAIAAVVPPEAMEDLNPTQSLLAVARHSLEGAISDKRKLPREAIQHLGEAIRLEDGLRYSEPPDWLYPIRHQLGELLLQRGRATEAEAVFRADLARHPEDGRSLHGLARALRLQQRGDEAGEVEKRFLAAWQDADVSLGALAE
jgi:tetratricopeptide (TPR) repeat protein